MVNVFHCAPDYVKNKEETMVQLQTKTPGPNICGSGGNVLPGVMGTQIQNWGKNEDWSTREIPMIMKAMEAGIIFQAHALSCPSDTDDPGKQFNLFKNNFQVLRFLLC